MKMILQKSESFTQCWSSLHLVDSFFKLKGQNWRSYFLNNGTHQKCGTSNKLVAKITVGIELTSGEAPQQT